MGCNSSRSVGRDSGLDDIVISRAIIDTFYKELLEDLEVKVAIAGAGPSGLTAAYYLAQAGIKTVIFERNLRPGGGMPGGGMMFNQIVVQKEAKEILDQLGVHSVEYQPGYYTASALETTGLLIARAIQAGARVYNLIAVEDVVVRDQSVCGLVINWSAVELGKLHVDPLSIRSLATVDATGHQAEVARIVAAKGGQLFTPTGQLMGERSMWAEEGERQIVENTKEAYPGLFVCGMAANAVFGGYRMGPIFGGMLSSGRRVAQLILEKLEGRPLES